MHIASSTTSVVLVEGESDRQAVLATASKLARDLGVEGVEIVAMGGATNVDKYVHSIGMQDVLFVGLCDAAELHYFERVLDTGDIFICHDDLEDELIRAIGVDEMLAFIESQGELRSFLTLQKQPAQRDRTVEQHLRRFCGVHAGRKVRYAHAMLEWLETHTIPTPLTSLIAHV